MIATTPQWVYPHQSHAVSPDSLTSHRFFLEQRHTDARAPAAGALFFKHFSPRTSVNWLQEKLN
jgi:hypothetical protein